MKEETWGSEQSRWLDLTAAVTLKIKSVSRRFGGGQAGSLQLREHAGTMG